MKTSMTTCAQRSIRAWLLVGLLGTCGWVVAQTMPEPRTSDGRAFSALSEEELEKLSKRDQDAYEAWLDEENARLTAEAKEREERIARKAAEAEAQMMEYVLSFKRLHVNQNKLGFNGTLYQKMKRELLSVVSQRSHIRAS